MQNTISALPKRPPFWFQLSIPAGNLLQLAGIILGAALLYLAANLPALGALRVLLMILGWFSLYVCTHASAHWLVGRLVGIRFRGYGVRGTDHPENYSGVFRQVMTSMPTFTVMSQKDSLRAARPVAKALMFAAGETSTTIFSVLAGWYAWQSGIPGGFVFFLILVIFTVLADIATAKIPRGDYAKALQVLRSPQKNS